LPEKKSGVGSSFLPEKKSGVGSSFLPEKTNRHRITRKDEPTPDYAPEDMLGLEESQGQGPLSTYLCLKGVTMRRLFTLEYWRDGDWYVGRLMEVPGVFSQGESLDELRENIQEAYELMVTQDRTAAPPFAERQDVELEV
jgi:predicted RNase H-like HicB family nuclease